MEKITVYKSLFDSKGVAFYITIDQALERVKIGKSKDLIQKIRKESNKEKRNKLKEKCICVLFNGEFSSRNDNSLVNHSGYCVLDFDNFESKKVLKEQKELLKKDKYIYSVFVSPSGNGLKALVKIPKCTKEEHPLYFNELKKHFNSKYFDSANKNVSRICYESYDSDIYINKNSELWDKIEVKEGYNYIERVPTIPVNDEAKIISLVMKWWESKYGIIEGQINNNLFILASAFNTYGIHQSTSIDYMITQFNLSNKINEVTNINRSAYSKVGDFKTKYFEDAKAITDVKRKLSNGVSKIEVKEELLKRVQPLEADKIISEIKETIENFWSISVNKQGVTKVNINNADFKIFLQSKGFFKYYAEKSETPIFVRVKSNIVSNSSVEKMKDFVLDYVENLKLWDVWNYLTSSVKFFKDSYLNMLDSIDLKMLQDTKDNSFIYYSNGVVEVTKTSIELIDYVDIDGYIWENQIIKRDFHKSKDIENDFKDLVSKVSDNNKDRRESLENTIGYLMHSFKDKTDQKAIILNDQEINDDPNGGSGKSLMLTAIGYFKKVVKIDGKSFDPSRSDFVYQRVDIDTQTLAFDDVKKNFNFENLFSLITEGITVNRKNKDEIFIPFERSPKVIITTNYVIDGAGNSHDRRRHEIEFNQFFNGSHTPLDEYGKLLFDEWDSNEWVSFDNYMINNLQKFLINGLTSTVSINADVKRFIQSTSKDFYDWIEDGNLKPNVKYYNTEKKEEFIKEYKEFTNLSGRAFLLWVQKWCNLKGYTLDKRRDSSRYFVMIDEANKWEDNNEDIF